MFKGSVRLKHGASTSRPAALQMDSGSSHKFELALRVERHGDDLQLDWNHAAPVLANASGGILTIREGNAKETHVMLDGDLLRTGAIVYRPVHGDIVLRLAVLGQGAAKLGESVTSVSTVTGSDSYKESK